MRTTPLCVAALASVLIAGGVPLALAGASSAGAPVLIVSTASDALNGDVSSPAALIAHPGSDGISLREAITAADHAHGPQTITFASSLAGKTITPTRYLPAFTHDGTALIGKTDASGQPVVRLDGGGQGRSCCGGLLAVWASDVTLTHLHIADVRNDDLGIAIRAGEPSGEIAIHDVRIVANVIEGTGLPGVGIGIGTDFPGLLSRSSGSPVAYPGATNASLTDLAVTSNVIKGFTDDGINVQLVGTHCSIRNLSVEGNTLANNTGMGSPALELGMAYSGNTIDGTRILRNTFTGNWAGIHLNGGVSSTSTQDGTVRPATGNTISGTVISGNIFDNNQQGIAFNGGVEANATSNSTTGTEISNSVFTRNAPFGAIGIQGGGGGAHGNRIDGVSIDNDSIAFNEGGIGIQGAAGGNAIANIQVQNTIFWMNVKDVGGPDSASAPPTIRNSLIGVDPRFVSSQDLHLQSGSPATDGGGTSGAPSVDFDNGLRDKTPDIGALEFGATARPFLNLMIDAVGGTGSVSSTPSGMSCQTSCETAFAAHTPVTLTAATASGSRFAGWTGACVGTGPCKVTLDGATSVIATFAPATVKPATPPRCKKGQKSTAAHRCR
jgi:hypothetical protein